MKAYIITLSDKEAEVCLNSVKEFCVDVTPITSTATTPKTIQATTNRLFGNRLIKWNWPRNDSENGYDLYTGLYKKAYRAADINKVAACALSHAYLWNLCVKQNEEIMILEQDAVFTSKFERSMLDVGKENFISSGIVSLNDPRGATRKAGIYHEMLKSKAVDATGRVFTIPNIDYEIKDGTMLSLPRGLPGNSAYIIKPYAAKNLLEKIKEIGLWPNDALMCYQLFPYIRACYPYFTKVQGTESTTTK